MKNSRCVLRNLAVLAGMDCAATLGGKLFAALGVPETNIVVLYLFAVLLVARLTQGYQYGILASVTSLLCFNFYFTAPYHTFAVNDPSYLITFFVMLVTSLLTSAMTTKEKILTRQANERGGGKPDSLYALQPPVRRRRHGTGPWRGAGQREQAAAGGCGLCLSWRPGAADRAAAGWGGRSFTAVWRTPGSCAPGLPTCAPSTWPGRRAFVFGHLYEGRSRSGR